MALPLLAAGGALLQGGLGFFKARSQKKQAEEMERANRAANVLDQAWSGLLGQKAKRQEDFEKPSVLGAALQGGLGGAMQGANVYQGLQGLKGNKEMLDKLRMAKERMTSDNQMTLGD
jgi:hypothetical protein